MIYIYIYIYIYYVLLKELPGISMCRCLCAGSMCSYVLLCAGSMCGTVFPTIKYGPTWAHMGPCGPIYEISRNKKRFFCRKKSPCGNTHQPGLGFIYIYIYISLYIPIIPIIPINPIIAMCSYVQGNSLMGNSFSNL